MKHIKKFFKTLFLTIFIGGFVLFAILAFKYFPILKEYKTQADKLVSNSTEKDFRPNETSFIYADDGSVLAKLKSDSDSEYLTFNEIPENVINAFIAIEDRTFWNNRGYDLKGIIRVSYNAIKTKGETLHGASTITQQLARLTFLTNEVSMERKIKEIFISVELTKKYTKQQIMEFYCNDVYFANGYYGIASAAKGYFDKTVDELSLSETAYLCAIPNRPSYFDPYKNVENAIDRRDKILSDMLELDMISDTEYQNAISETIKLFQNEEITYDYNTSYAIDCAIRYLMKVNGFEFQYHFDSKNEYLNYLDNFETVYEENRKQLYSGGYKVYTSLNKEAQQIVQNSLDEILQFDEEKKENGIYALQGASTVIDNETGKVIAIVGGRSSDEQYGLNRAFQSYRQPGSTMKPLVVYTPALEMNFTSNSILQNISVTEANRLFEENKSSEIDNLTGDYMTLRQAVASSKNGCAYFLFHRVGIENGISYLENMNFAKITNQDYNLSTALGGLTYGVSTVEMASAYATIENSGKFIEPTCITSFKTSENEEIFEEEYKEVYDSNAARKMTDVLTEVVKSGTARSMKWESDIPVACKTGTTNDAKDGWFCGFTPYYTMSVWVGYDTPRPLQKLWGSTYPCYIWQNAMIQLVEGKKVVEFEKPEMTPSTGDEKYLPGRSDDEILSGNYTVGDYRSDYALVDEVDAIAVQIEQATDMNVVEDLYQQGLVIVETIYGNNATAKARERLETAHNSRIGIVPQPTVPVTP